jgi:hypothetical protein
MSLIFREHTITKQSMSLENMELLCNDMWTGMMKNDEKCCSQAIKKMRNHVCERECFLCIYFYHEFEKAFHYSIAQCKENATRFFAMFAKAKLSRKGQTMIEKAFFDCCVADNSVWRKY